ncbi:MAG: energy transducer TonB [Bacteroidia bacterium]
MPVFPSKIKYDRSLFLMLGLSLSMAFMLMAFRYNRVHHFQHTEAVADFVPKPIDLDEQLYSQRKPPAAKQQLSVASSDALLFQDNLPDMVVELLGPAIASVDGLPDLPPDLTGEPDLHVAVREVFPKFPGGDAALLAFLKKHLSYTSYALESRVQGIVVLQFVVRADGSISEIKVLRSLGFGLDEEAIRVVRKMPRWEPGYQGGNPVAVAYNLPIRFSLGR